MIAEMDFFNLCYDKNAIFRKKPGSPFTCVCLLLINNFLVHLQQGSINRDQFLQIVLIYIGTAADILELSEIFDDNLHDKEEYILKGIYYGTIAVWALGISQFGITLALPEEGLKQVTTLSFIRMVK